jgi:YjbE family integral membrane protein
MEFLNELQTAQFWAGLWQIILINIVLSGDNAVVIALAARSLPARQQTQAVIWGAGAAVVMRIILTIIAVEMLKWPWLKLIGAALLLWIAIKLLVPEEGGEGDVRSSDNMWSAIKTILIADLVMSLDNVIAVAAAARGSLSLLILGLAISIPLVVFGATMLMKLMERWPIIITIGAALLGFVAGEMAATDPALDGWLRANFTYVEDVAMVGPVSLKVLCGTIGAILVVGVGKWLAGRQGEEEEHAALAAAPTVAVAEGAAPRWLVAVDGSGPSMRAIEWVIKNMNKRKIVAEIHLLNAQRPLPGHAASHLSQEQLQEHHQGEGTKALADARARLDAAGVKYRSGVRVGDEAEVISEYARENSCELVLIGTRGLSSMSNLLLGSVATNVIQLSPVPVLLVK